MQTQQQQQQGINNGTIGDRVRAVLAEEGALAVDIAKLGDDADLYRAGLTSLASVNVMLALEEVFGVDIPEELLRRATFGSVAAIRDAMSTLLSRNQEG